MAEKLGLTGSLMVVKMAGERVAQRVELKGVVRAVQKADVWVCLLVDELVCQ